MYPGVDIKAASVTVVSAGMYGAKFTEMPFLFEIYGNVDLDFALQGDNAVTKAEAAKDKTTKADDFPAPPSVKTNLLNITASAVAGGFLRTRTRSTLNRRAESGRLYEVLHSP